MTSNLFFDETSANNKTGPDNVLHKFWIFCVTRGSRDVQESLGKDPWLRRLR